MLQYEITNAHNVEAGQLIGWTTERIGHYDLERAFRILTVTRQGIVTRIEMRDAVTGEQVRVEIDRHVSVRLLSEHYPTCNQCGSLWPCREELIEAVSRETAEYLNAQCVVCGDRWGARMAEVRTETPDGVAVRRYHTRKGSRCRTAYLKAVANDPIALAELRREDAGWARP